MSRYGRNDPGEHDSRIVQRCYNYACERVVLEHLVTGFGDDEVILGSVVTSSDSEDYPIGLSVANADLGDFQLIDCVDCSCRDWVLSDAETHTADFDMPAGILGFHIENTGTGNIYVNGKVVRPGTDHGAAYAVDTDVAGTGSAVSVTFDAGGEAEVQYKQRAGLPCVEAWIDNSLKIGSTRTIDPSPADNLCNDITGYAVSNVVNATVVSNGDGTYDVTPNGAACGGAWSFDRTITCANGATATESVSGDIDDTPITHALHTSNETFARFRVVLSAVAPYTIDWGDGTVETFNSGLAFRSHTYDDPYSGFITITHSSCYEFTVFNSTHGHWDFDLADISPQIGTKEIFIEGDNVVTGNIADAPPTVGTDIFWFVGDNTITGNVADIPPMIGTVRFKVDGDNTLTGLIADTPPTVGTIQYDIRGDNTIGGTASSIPPTIGTSSFHLRGFCGVTGTLADVPATVGTVFLYVCGLT